MLKLVYNIMNKRKPNLAKLKPKLIDGESSEAGNSKTLATLAPNSINTLQYFSPKKTRSKIKIEYDERPSKIKTETVDEKIPKKEIKTKAAAAAALVTVKKNDESATEVEAKKPKWEPKNWMQTLENIREMRKYQGAPVDTMGCHKCHDNDADEKTQRYQVLIALMLSSQTKYQTNFAAMQRLREHGLTPANIVKSDANVLEKLINPVSFYKTKTKNIQKATQILINEYASDIPGFGL